MTIEELGIIANIGSSIAVILTLGFLAFQVRRARLEASRQNARDMINNNNEVLLRLSDNDALLDVEPETPAEAPVTPQAEEPQETGQ
jgi:hypothetical protein